MSTRIQGTEDYQIYRETAEEIEEMIEKRLASDTDYYWLVSKWARVAIGAWARGLNGETIAAARKCVNAVLDYFYGPWREVLTTANGLSGDIVWRQRCLWYDEVQRTLPFAAAVSDWAAMTRIANYPPEDRLPEAAKARGETAWGWALITFIRGEGREKIEAFLAKAEDDKAKRPKLLAQVLRGLISHDELEYAQALVRYLEYFSKHEFRTELDKAVALDGTTLYHLGRKAGFIVNLPKSVENYVVRFDE